ncbi:flagellar M-ring protein FliF [Vibrio maritimus]|uniref:Flagellar M-ring protein FliF n=1 Tax=Vibrio maritimus TaxID=990268 RepID=A0A090S758_9VIBR|nr:flagellar M-ring protein FliF [Vibrio maritimus]
MSELAPQTAATPGPIDVAPKSTPNNMNDVQAKLKQLWSSSQRNLVLSAVLAAIVAAIIVVALWSSSQSYRPLYSQQERFDIGEIVSVLESEALPTDCKSRTVKYWWQRVKLPKFVCFWRRKVSKHNCQRVWTH